MTKHIVDIDLDQVIMAAFRHFDTIKNACFKHNVRVSEQIGEVLFAQIVEPMIALGHHNVVTSDFAMEFAVGRVVSFLEAAKNDQNDQDYRGQMMEKFTSVVKDEFIKEAYTTRLKRFDEAQVKMLQRVAAARDPVGAEEERNVSVPPKLKRSR